MKVFTVQAYSYIHNLLRVTNTQKVTKTLHLPVHVHMAGVLQSSSGSHEENAGVDIDLF